MPAIIPITVVGALKVAAVAGAIVYSRQQAKKAKKALRRLANISSEAEQRTTNSLSVDDPRVTIYGEREVGGTIILRHVTGDARQYLNIVIVMASHECESISNLKVAGELVPLDSSGNAIGRYADRLEAHFFLGSELATAPAPLLANCPDVWTADHTLKGLAGVYVRMYYDADLFSGGAPEIKALVKGKKIYDPRTDLTTWSNNPALCIADYMTDTQLGMGFDYDTEIDEQELIASANNCDEQITDGDGVTRSRYTLNAAITADTVFEDALDDMAQAMAGYYTYIGGKWKIISGYYRTPTLAAFTEDSIVSEIRMTSSVGVNENFNRIKGQFVNPDSYWQAADFPPVVNSYYLAEDNNVPKYRNPDLSLSMVTVAPQAQRIAKIELEKIRQPIQLNFDGNLSWLRVQAGDVVPITLGKYGFMSKYFEVVTWGLVSNGDGALVCPVSLRETASAVYDWNDGEETSIDLAPNTTLVSPFDIKSPTGLTVTCDTSTRLETISGTAIIPRIRVSWTMPEDEYVKSGGAIEVQYRLSTTDLWQTWATVPGTTTAVYIDNPQESSTYLVRIRSRNRLVSSAWVYSTPTATPGDTTPPAAPTSFAATGAVSGIRLNWTNGSDTDASHTEIYWAATNTPDPTSSTDPLDTTDSASANTYFLSGLSGGVTKYCWIRRVDTSGNKSAWVGPRGATTVTPLSVTVTPGSAEGDGPPSIGNIAETNTVTAVVSGGVGPFTFLWEQDPASVGAYDETISDASAATVSWTWGYPFTEADQQCYVAGNWRCKVTDSAGTVAYSQWIGVSVTFQ